MYPIKTPKAWIISCGHPGLGTPGHTSITRIERNQKVKFYPAPDWCPLREEECKFYSRSDTYESTSIRNKMRQEYWRCGQKK